MAIQFGFNTEEALHSYHYSINDLCVKAPAENVEKQEGEGLDQETAKKVMTTVPKHLKIVSHCVQKGEGENQNSDVNPTLTATDSSDCLGIISAPHDVDDIGIFSVEDRELSHTSSSFENMGPLLRSSSINSTGSHSDRISDHFFVTKTHAEDSSAFLGINQDVTDTSDPYEQAARAQSHHFRGKLAELYDSGVPSDDPLTEENLHFSGGVLQSSSSSSSSISTAEESFSSSRKRKERNELDIEDPAASSQNIETVADKALEATQPLQSTKRTRRNHRNYNDGDLINLLQCWKYLYLKEKKKNLYRMKKILSDYFHIPPVTGCKYTKAMESCLDCLRKSKAANENPEKIAKDIETIIQQQQGIKLDILRKAMKEDPKIDPKAVTEPLLLTQSEKKSQKKTKKLQDKRKKAETTSPLPKQASEGTRALDQGVTSARNPYESSSSSSSSISTAGESFSSSRKRKQRNESDINIETVAYEVLEATQPLEGTKRTDSYKTYADGDLINLLQCWKYLKEENKNLYRMKKIFSDYFHIPPTAGCKYIKAMESCLDCLRKSKAANENPEEIAKDIETTIQQQKDVTLDILRKAMKEDPKIDPKAITESLLLAQSEKKTKKLQEDKLKKVETTSTKGTGGSHKKYDDESLINLLQCWKYLYLETDGEVPYGMIRGLGRCFCINYSTVLQYTRAITACLDSLRKSQAANKNPEEIAEAIETTIQEQKRMSLHILRKTMKEDPKIDPKAITDQLLLTRSGKKFQKKPKKAEKTAPLPKQASEGTRALDQEVTSARDPYESSSSSSSSISTEIDPTAYVHLAFLNESENKQVNDFLRRQPEKIQTALIDHLNNPLVVEHRQVFLRARKALLIECHFLLKHLEWHPRNERYLKNALPLDKSHTQEERFEAFLTYFDPTIQEALRYRKSSSRESARALASRFRIKEYLVIEACQLFEKYFSDITNI